MTGLQYVILQVLSEQSDGYLCSSRASAFIAAGLEDSNLLDQELLKLQKDDLVDFYTETEEVTVLKVKRDENGEPIYDRNSETVQPILDDDGGVQTEVISIPADEGWVITSKGRQELNG